MRKLNKKQALIIADINDSISTSLEVLREFHSQKRFEMVSHNQHAILEQLSGIASYLIHSQNKLWDDRLSSAYWEIRNMPELNLEYWMELQKSEDKVYETYDV